MDKFKQCNVRFAFGMSNVYCSASNVNLSVSPQSVSCIIYDCLSRISVELQRVLSNKRENQDVFSLFCVQLSSLAWAYLVEKLQLTQHVKEKVFTLFTMQGNDLSTTRVKTKLTCLILRVENRAALLQVIEIFGISAIVGVRKQPPPIIKKLRRNDACVTVRGPVQLKDALNLVDVASNALRPLPRRFTFNAYGCKGIDFIHLPSQNSLRMNVRYSCFFVDDALEKLQDLGMAVPRHGAHLSDEELELLLRGGN
jgi:hypothetical protein